MTMNLHVGVLHYDPSFEPFPLLRGPVDYEPNTLDLREDKAMLQYWLGVLSDSIQTIMAKAIASEAGTAGNSFYSVCKTGKSMCIRHRMSCCCSELPGSPQWFHCKCGLRLSPCNKTQGGQWRGGSVRSQSSSSNTASRSLAKSMLQTLDRGGERGGGFWGYRSSRTLSVGFRIQNLLLTAPSPCPLRLLLG